MKHEGFYLMKQYETSTWDFGWIPGDDRKSPKCKC
jgi:hypothetical protein